jgi:CBS domain containing-hemolysin-like protein
MEEISLASLLWRGLAVLVLVAANAFFVAAEFALVASRRTRIEALAREGDTQAKLVLKAIQSLDRYISATQLGITLASLGLGWIGEPAVASVFQGLFQGWPSPFDLIATHGVASAIAFALITVLHIVLGELAPKSLAILHPEATSRWVVAPLIGFTIATNPFIWLLNGAANATLRVFGMRAPTESERVHRPEEIVMLVKRSQESGHMARQDVRLIEGVFEFSEKTARDVMTPRTDVIALEETLTVEEAAKRIGDAGRSRYPVYGESADDVIGVIHAKQILATLGNAKYQKLKAIVSEPLFVPGSREVEDLLTDMKRAKRHMAIVVDEYGGTAGIVTMEDLLEEIVGEIYDEYDGAEAPPSPAGEERTLPGNMEIDEANEKFGLGIETDQFQTVGGFVFGTLGRLPKEGDVVPVNDARLEVLKMDKRRVAMLRIAAGP